MKQETKRFTIDLPIDQHSCIKMIAAQEGISMKEYVIESLIKNIQSRRQSVVSDDEFKQVMDEIMNEYGDMFKRLADK